MTDLFDPWEHAYSAADLTAATGGLASKRVLQNWHSRGQWLTAIEPTLRGKSYSYSFAHVLEAVLVVELAEYGVTNELARLAIASRLASEPLIGPKRNAKPVGIEDLPELRGKGGFWGVSPRSSTGETTASHDSVVVLVIEPNQLASTLEGWPSVLLLNIPALLKKATDAARTSARLQRANLQLKHSRPSKA